MGKLSHKLTLICVKYLPMIVAIVELLGTILSFLSIETAILGYLFGASGITIIPMYITSYTFKFCKYHRMIINYIVANKLMFLLDYIFILPIGSTGLITLATIMAFIFLTLIIYNYLKYGDKSAN